MSAHYVSLFLLWTAVAVGVGIHADNRDRSGFLWFLATFFLGILGVLVYLLVITGGGDEPEDVRVCPNCSAGHPGSPNYCSSCGEPLGADDEASVARIIRSGSRAYCSDCTSRVGLDADVCPNCRSTFSLAPAEESNVADIVRSGSRAYCGSCKSRVTFDADACSSCGSVF